jgi:hypothetical protein
MCCAKRNTASYAELLNMNELTTVSIANLPAGRWWVFVFVIQFLVHITILLINLVISMNLWRKAPCRRWR